MPRNLALHLLSALNVASAIAACTAAGLWWKSAAVKVPYDEKIPSGLNVDCLIDLNDGTDFLRTVIASALWSKRAAFAAGVSAAIQAAAAMLG